MKTCTEYLDEAKAAAGITSDYALAKRLGLTHSSISLLRTRGGTFSDETAIKIAEMIGTDPAAVLLDANAQRAGSDAEKRVWLRLRKQLSKAGKTVACTLLAAGMLSVSQVADLQASPAVSQSGTVCIMLSLLGGIIWLSRRAPLRQIFPSFQ